MNKNIESIWDDPDYCNMLEGVLERDVFGYKFIERFGGWANLPDMTIVDAGCGFGRMAALFSKANYRGFDSSEKLVWHCKERGLAVERANIYRLPVVSFSADLVIAHAVLLHIGYPEDALKELWRITKHRLIFSCFYRRWGLVHRGPTATWTEDKTAGRGWWMAHNYVPLWMWSRMIGRLPQLIKVQRIRYTGCEPIFYYVLDRDE